MYDPTVGRWTSEDPIRTAAGDTNLQRYVRNSPTNYTDPTGLKVRVGDKQEERTRKQVEDSISEELKKGGKPPLGEKNKAVLQEILDAYLGPDYDAFYGTDVALAREIIFRINIVAAAQELANAGHKFTTDQQIKDRILIGFTKEAKYWESFKVKGDTGITLRKETPVGLALRELFTTKGTAFFDCTIGVRLSILEAYHRTVPKDVFDSRVPSDLSIVVPYVGSRPLTDEKHLIKWVATPAAKSHKKPIPGDIVVWDNPTATNKAYERENTIYLGTALFEDKQPRYYGHPYSNPLTEKELLEKLMTDGAATEKAKPQPPGFPVDLKIYLDPAKLP